MSDIVIYEDGNVELKATLESESIWLKQNEIAKLFNKDRTVITRHINNILKDNEVDEKSNVQKMLHIANSDKPVKFYSKRLQEQKLQELEDTLHLIRQTIDRKELSANEVKGFVAMESNYAKSWALLQGYDEQSLQEVA